MKVGEVQPIQPSLVEENTPVYLRTIYLLPTMEQKVLDDPKEKFTHSLTVHSQPELITIMEAQVTVVPKYEETGRTLQRNWMSLLRCTAKRSGKMRNLSRKLMRWFTMKRFR